MTDLPPDLPRCCGNCKYYGTKTYGDKRACCAKHKMPSLKGQPSCIRIDKRMMRANDGQSCPVFLEKGKK